MYSAKAIPSTTTLKCSICLCKQNTINNNYKLLSKGINKMKSIIFGTVFILICFTTSSYANIEISKSQSSSLMKYCQLDECKSYFKLYKKAAKRGHAGAMAILGQFYYNGYGTEPNENKAIKFLKRAARYADTSAQYKLGLIYLTSKTNYDLDDAIKYLEKAAKKDDENANLLLGTIYYNNQFAPQNFALADKYLSKSYQQRHPQIPTVVKNIKAKVSLDNINFPLLYQELTKTPLIVKNNGVIEWPEEEIEVVTITSPPLTQLLTENLVAYRRAITSTGSRIPGKSCGEIIGCDQSLGRDLSGFSAGLLNVIDITGK